MRLKQKQFVPFMIIVAVITMIVIVFSSFNFMQKQQKRFKENIVNSDTLNSIKLGRVGTSDSLNINQFKGQNTLLVFWATWSDKSESMLSEIQFLKDEYDALVVLAGLVKDAEESLPDTQKYPEFIYLDAAFLYNHLKVPGIPSYILFGKEGEILHSNVGYKKGVGYDSLKIHLQ